MMKRISKMIMVGTAVLASCCAPGILDRPHDVVDHSFDLQVTVDDVRLGTVGYATVTLTVADPSAGFVMTCDIDGDESLEVCDREGTVLPREFPVETGGGKTLQVDLCLPLLDRGGHMLTVDVASGTFSQRRIVPFEVMGCLPTGISHDLPSSMLYGDGATMAVRLLPEDCYGRVDDVSSENGCLSVERLNGDEWVVRALEPGSGVLTVRSGDLNWTISCRVVWTPVVTFGYLSGMSVSCRMPAGRSVNVNASLSVTGSSPMADDMVQEWSSDVVLRGSDALAMTASWDSPWNPYRGSLDPDAILQWVGSNFVSGHQGFGDGFPRQYHFSHGELVFVAESHDPYALPVKWSLDPSLASRLDRWGNSGWTIYINNDIICEAQ